jgi:hypothetical protein
MKINYINNDIKKTVRLWKPTLNFNAESEIANHLFEKFEIDEVLVVEAKNCGDHLMLVLQSNIWKTSREFGLLDNGSLVW